MKAHSPNHQHETTKAIFDFLPGPVKIKDGLFMGDEISARVLIDTTQDIEFIISNKVTHVINTVSKHIPNLWERFGIHYLSVNWTEKQQNIFDKKNNSVNTIFQFVEEAMEQGESCLIHSINGKSRACAVLAAYLMRKYCWSLNKCLEFVALKKDRLEIRKGYMEQLEQLDERMRQIYNLTSDWGNEKTEEELILKNTMMNSKTPAFVSIEKSSGDHKSKRRVNLIEKPTIHRVNQQRPSATSKQQVAQFQLKSILRGAFQNSNENLPEKDNVEGFSGIQGMARTKKEGNFINSISGNVVHITVNNFINSGLKTGIPAKNSVVNSRPFSSDQKERQKEKRIVNRKKILPYDTNGFLPFKSPYDAKLGNRVNSNNKILKQKIEEKESKVAGVYERPQSAKNQTGSSINFKEDMMITKGISHGYIKKRYPSNPREELLKRKLRR